MSNSQFLNDNVANLCYAISIKGGGGMGKTSTIRARIEPDLKDKAENIFRRLGLTTTQAITLFYKQVELKMGLPFDIALPNEITHRTLDDTDEGRNILICNNTEDMFKKLGI